MRVLSTRETADGFKRRRYETATGHRFSTVEVPLEVWNRMNSPGRARNRFAQVMTTLDRESTKRQAKSLRAAGLSCREIAGRLSIPVRTIQRYVK